MSTRAGSLAGGLVAALMLARGRAEGALLAGTDRLAVIRSFWAIGACVPIILALRLTGAAPGAGSGTSALASGRGLLHDVLVLAVGWLGFVLASHRVATILQRADRWPRFIVVWNWCNVLGNALVLLGAIPDLLGAPTILGEAAQLFALGWALWIEWYAIRIVLGVSALAAVWLVMLDETIGLLAALLGMALGGG